MMRIRLTFLLLAFFSAWATAVPASPPQEPLYKDASAPPEERVEDLLGRMTLAEKVGQMTQINFSAINGSGQEAVQIDPDLVSQAIRRYHVGSFLNGIAVPASQWHEYSDQLQRINMRESRLGIPIIYGMDHIHGANYLSGATIFPQPFNLAATFNTELVRRMAKITVVETQGLGHHWIFAPVLGLARQPAWPRVYETFGADALLASRMGTAFIEGLREASSETGDGHLRAACAKHFLGYSVPDSGYDRTPVDISWQSIREYLLPPFKAAIDAGVRTVMINSGEINGIPVHASKPILTGLLRQELGFEGVALTDWEDIIKLVNFHKVAEDERQATQMAVEAGIDMAMTPYTYAFSDHLQALVREGVISEERVDTSVRRVLRLKFELGLFEHPYPAQPRGDLIGAAQHRREALQAARESIVLLKNEGLLPLAEDAAHLLVTGPAANSKRNLGGGWTLRWTGGKPEEYPRDMLTIHEALARRFGASRVTLMEDIGEPGSQARRKFEEAAASADAVIVAVGEEPYAEVTGQINDLTLDSGQLELVGAAAGASSKVVLLLVQGRPRVVPPHYAQSLPAMLMAGLPGFEGAEAIADVLSGRFNPSGRLPLSYPAYPTHTVPYNHKATDKSSALFPFGHGLSYTRFEYSGLEIDGESHSPGQEIEARVTVRNAGERTGQESVLWFVTDEVGSITRPVRELKHFEKIELQPGQSRTLRFTIVPGRDLAFPDARGKKHLEPGSFTLSVGGLKTAFKLTP
ncbi:MAG TPA: glycoside hydrolase family 3 N-terminal domain-containing protein [Acidobacteriota bacterium]|nr:glycoside hydrolase family 3 N-terminal domain-containing protein [Acidobacteriota bacterium]